MTCEPQSIVHHLIRIPQNVTKQVKKCNSSLLMAERLKKSSSSGSLTSWMTSSSATSTTGNSNKMNDSWGKNSGITTPFRYTRRKKTKSFQIDRSGVEDCSIITMEPPVTPSQPKDSKKESPSPRGYTCPPMDSYDKNPINDDGNDDAGSITSHDEDNYDVSISLATFNKMTNFQSSSQERLMVGDSIPQGDDDSIVLGLVGTSFSRAQTFRPHLEREISFRSTQIVMNNPVDDSDSEDKNHTESTTVLPLEDIDQIGFMTKCMIDTSRPCFVHFYVEGSDASGVLDAELGQLHARCRVDKAPSSSSSSLASRPSFMRIAANSAPFVTSKLKINTHEPCVICFHNGQIFERITDTESIVQHPGHTREWVLGTGLLEL
jgi:hypothetical protein